MSEISELRQAAVKERESISDELRYISRQREENGRGKALVASERVKIEEEKKNMLNVKKEMAVIFQKDIVPFEEKLRGFLMVRIIYLGIILLICINELREQQMPREMLIT